MKYSSNFRPRDPKQSFPSFGDGPPRHEGVRLLTGHMETTRKDYIAPEMIPTDTGWNLVITIDETNRKFFVTIKPG